MSWNADPLVESVLGRSIDDLLTGRPRRQSLEGFDPIYSDIVDYIVRCTHRIWEEKNVGLIRTHYSAECPVIALSGCSRGAEEVVRNTIASLVAYPDRRCIAEDVIWSEDQPGVFLSSHRLVSHATFSGPDGMFDTISGVRTPILVIADCVCRANEIIAEWLVRDYVQLVRSHGYEPRKVAAQLAEKDRQGDPVRHAWRTDEIARVRAAPDRLPPPEHPAAAISCALMRAFNQDLYGDASAILSPSIELRWPSGRNLTGRGAWIGCLIQLRGNLTEQRWILDHWAARPLPDGDVAVALRWWLTGKHTLAGAWGTPSGRELLLLGISHYRLRAGRILEDTTVFDELGVLRQIAGGLGA